MRQGKEFLPKLLEYIGLANKIPPGFKFPDYSDVTELTKRRIPNFEWGFNSLNDLVETYKEICKDFPSDLFAYIFESNKGVMGKLDLLEIMHHSLTSLARAVTKEHLSEDDTDDINQIIKGFYNPLTDLVLVTDASISVDSEGFLIAKTNEFFEFIANHKIDARRIRSCLICQKIFWANRSDKWTCSQTCGNTLRQRIWQSENKDEYNEKRRKNYAYKQKLKNKEKKENGTL